MRKIEIENTKIEGAATIYTLSSWHCCRDAMLRVFFRDKRKATTPVRHCGLDPQRREASRLYISGDSDFRQNDGNGYGDSDLRQNDGNGYRDSDLRQNDGNGYGDSDLRRNDRYRYTGAMSRRGLNMYNPLQAKRSWGYRTTTTFSELRSSSICRSEYRRSDLKGFSQIRKKSAVIFLNLRHLRACLLPYKANLNQIYKYIY
jgi:hypothetical protein